MPGRNQVIGVPGARAERTSVSRAVLKDPLSGKFFPRGVIIDGSLSRDPTNTGDLDVLQEGLLMGQVTASNKFAPSIIGPTDALHDTSATPNAMTVPAAVAVELDRRSGQTGDFKITGPATAAGTVNTETVTPVSINTTTGVIDITGSTTTNDFIAGSFIRPADGSEEVLGILHMERGLRVTDIDSANIDVPLAELLVGGIIDSSVIVNFPTDTSLITFIKGELRDATLGFVFDDDYQ